MNASNLKDKLKLLTLFRLIMAVVFVAASFVFGMREEYLSLPPIARELVYVPVSALLLVCVVAAGLMERWEGDQTKLTVLAYAHFVGDALFATALVMLTGGSESIFTFLYSLAIINASIVLYRRGAMFAASANAVFLTVVMLSQLGYLGSVFSSLLQAGTFLTGSATLALDLRDVVPSVMVNVLAFFSIAFLSSFLAQQMRNADMRAREQKAVLDELSQLHENIVSSLEQGLITVGKGREILYINQAACHLLGRDREWVMGLHIEELVPDMGPVLENPDKSRQHHVETALQMVDGVFRHLRWTISPLKDRSGRQVGHILIFFDISPLKKMEEEIARSERLAALGRMAANIAHEIRNPLASLSASIQLLAASLNVEGPDRKLMDIIVREVENLNQWISEFLEYARPREPVFLELDLAGLVREVLDMLRNDERTRNVKMDMEKDGDCTIEGDTGRLRQVVWNLVLNAVEAVGAGGSVFVKVSGMNGSVALTVSDNGPGIEPALISKVFEPFFTTKASGTGLGLATVHRNVEEHYGRIQVESFPGERTSFIVTLPRKIPGHFPERSDVWKTDHTGSG